MDRDTEVHEQEKIQKDLLWGLYVELRNQARHSEILRTSVNNYILLISSALITLITFDREINRDDISMTLITVFVGVIGTVFSFSYTERYNRNRARALQIIKHLDSVFFESQSSQTLNSLNSLAEEKHFQVRLYKWVRKATSTHWGSTR